MIALIGAGAFVALALVALVARWVDRRRRPSSWWPFA